MTSDESKDENKKCYLLKISNVDQNNKEYERREHLYKCSKKCIDFMMKDIEDVKSTHTIYSQEERFYADVFKYIQLVTNCGDKYIWEITEIYYED